MILSVFSVFDSKARLYARPFFVQNEAVAKRLFAWLTRDPQSDVSKAPADYTLFRIAQFNDETGVLEKVEPHVNLGNGAQFSEE